MTAPFTGAAAIVLAGGRSSRLGGVDKASLRIDGERLVDRVVAAIRDRGISQPIVVGPPSVIPETAVGVREDPPFSGPLAALAAALPLVDPAATSVLLLSCDLAFPEQVLTALAQEIDERSASETAPADTGDAPVRTKVLSGRSEALVLEDPDGRAQWLAGWYPLAGLREGLAALGTSVENRPLRAAFTKLTVLPVSVARRTVHDIDTPADLEQARIDLGGSHDTAPPSAAGSTQ